VGEVEAVGAGGAMPRGRAEAAVEQGVADVVGVFGGWMNMRRWVVAKAARASMSAVVVVLWWGCGGR